ncbi:Tetratricopeptide repeat-containing protein [Amphritea atlantica]|uniref:Tetratricopeptide repeat-containing protein n=1 Tax=Amphritea atlantica TaxID=355243 RepID=A0A1H9CMA0_9GAMM|nr:tetratricopeptide repeat protein [Amphritea atlantica]SEQ02346.1 Tetratricopeptide repeat-containing protein [Amphritea atlantica]
MTDSQNSHSVKFWLTIIAFQIIFGLVVFGFTRQYYLSEPQSAATKPNLDWPVAGQTLSGDLLTGKAGGAQGRTPSAMGSAAMGGSGMGGSMGGSGMGGNSVGATSDLSVLQDPVEISRMANEMFAKQDYQQAAKLYEKLLSFDPENAATYNNLGLTLHYIGRSDEALKMLDEGSIIDPSNQRIWLTLGFVSNQMGDTEKARTALKTAVDLGADTQVGQSAAKMLAELP